MAKKKPDDDFLTWITADFCTECNRPCLRALNRISGKTGLVDANRVAVLVGFEPATRKEYCDGNTSRDFLNRVAHFAMKDAPSIEPKDIRFLSAHKFTCSKRPREAGRPLSLGIGGWVEPLIEGTCSQPNCLTPLIWIRNLATSNPVPCDARAPVYAVFAPAQPAAMIASMVDAELSTDFLKRCDGVVLHGGVTIQPHRLHFFVSHFATCTHPDQFRKPYGGRK